MSCVDRTRLFVYTKHFSNAWAYVARAPIDSSHPITAQRSVGVKGGGREYNSSSFSPTNTPTPPPSHTHPHRQIRRNRSSSATKWSIWPTLWFECFVSSQIDWGIDDNSICPRCPRCYGICYQDWSSIDRVWYCDSIQVSFPWTSEMSYFIVIDESVAYEGVGK